MIYQTVWSGRGAMPHEVADREWMADRHLPTVRRNITADAPGAGAWLTAEEQHRIAIATAGERVNGKAPRLCRCGRRLANRWTAATCAICVKAAEVQRCGCGRKVRGARRCPRCIRAGVNRRGRRAS